MKSTIVAIACAMAMLPLAAEAQGVVPPIPHYTTEQLCGLPQAGLEYFHRMCIGKNQASINFVRQHWSQVSDKTRTHCLGNQAMIERVSRDRTYVYSDAYYRLATCMYDVGIHEMMPTQVR